MKSTFTLFILTAVAITLSAQPEISDTWVPKPGDTWRQLAALDSVSPGEAGADVTWDFSDLGVGFPFQLTFEWIDTAGTPYVDSFPDANLCVTLGLGGFGTNYGYYRDGDNTFEYHGQGGDFGVDILLDPQSFAYIGLQYGETVVDSYLIVRHNTFLGTDTVPGASTFTYDGYGTVILPDVTIENAIRIYQEDIEKDSTTFFGSGSVSIDSLTTYAWIAEGSVFPVVQWQRSRFVTRLYLNGEIFNEELDDPEYTFSYDPDYGTTSSVYNASRNLATAKVYPTTTSGDLTIELEGDSERDFRILSMEGRALRGGNLSGSLTQMNVGDLPAGTYILLIEEHTPQLFVRQ